MKEENVTWNAEQLEEIARRWFADLSKSKGAAGEESVECWNFRYSFKKNIKYWIDDFINRYYRFSPMLASWVLAKSARSGFTGTG